jgi:hypothetical protein
MNPVVVNSEISLQSIIGELRSMWHEHRYLRVTVKTGKDRSLDQNSISHAWYEQVARELREYDALGVKRYCKLHFGVPILRAEDAEFREFYDTAIKRHLSYEQKLKAMDMVPVTSLMSVKQLSAYLIEMQEHYKTRDVKLVFPASDEQQARAA